MPSLLSSLIGPKPTPEAHKDSLQNTSNALHTLFTAEGLEFLKGHELTPENHEFLDRLVAHIKEPPSDEPAAKEKARLALQHLSRKEIYDKHIEQLPAHNIHPIITLNLGQYLEHARTPALSQRSEKSASQDVLGVVAVETNPIDDVMDDTADNGAEKDDNDSISLGVAANPRKRQSTDSVHSSLKKPKTYTTSWGKCLELEECVLDPRMQNLVGRGDGAFDFLFSANDNALSNCKKGLAPCALFVSQLQVIKHQAGFEKKGTASQASQERVKWLFLMLLVADMEKTMFPELQSSTTLTGRKRKLATCVMDKLTEADKVDLKLSESDYDSLFQTTLPWVYSIEQLCGHFNEGILLFLARLLNKSFIEQKMTFSKAKSEAEGETSKTPHGFIQLQKHFTALKVVQTLKENGATEVGKTIRGRLKQEHNIEQVARDPHVSSEDHQANSDPGSGIQEMENTGSGEAIGEN